VTELLAALSLLLLFPAGYLLLLALACQLRPAAARVGCRTRIAVLIPAQDEELLVGRCLDSLRAQAYPAHLVRLVVVADNCRDGTAGVARARGAEVLERRDPDRPGKGRALRWAMDQILASDPPDAVAVVDADSVAEPGLLAGLAGAFEAGAEAVQADYQLLPGSSPRGWLLAAAFLLFHRVRFGGRAALGLPAALAGNGMLFGRSLLQRLPWDAFSGVEDLERTQSLRLAGVAVRFAPGAVVRGETAASARGQTAQRLRWEGGRFHVVRRWVPRLLAAGLRSRDPGLVEAALELAIPPLGLLAILGLAGLAAGAGLALVGAAGWPAVIAWGSGLAVLVAYVLLGLRAAGAPWQAFVALAAAPLFLARKLVVYARLVRFDPRRWDRSDRAIGGVVGVPLAPVDLETAVVGISERLICRPPIQVCTVNLDFLAHARRDPEVAAILARTLNLADGVPVLWLARLAGCRLPGRVAGSDLVPRLVAAAAARGARVLLLGGEHGAAEAAARQLRMQLPGLVLAVHEPPRAALEEMDDEAILAQIEAAAPDLLLVAFGHPKQEKWIARNLSRLPVGVAMGVGCCFDLIAGRVQRAPGWMQRAGLEWLYRLGREPHRLAGRYLEDGVFFARSAAAVLLRLA
jgi:exopolysaccharide biosynthesis WecB/TagA/CpsF family protein